MKKIAFDEMSVNRALATINSQVVEYSSEKLAGVTAGLNRRRYLYFKE